MAHLSITVFYNELKRTLPFVPHHHPQVALEDLHEAAQRILAGQIRGRVVVNLALRTPQLVVDTRRSGPVPGFSDGFRAGERNGMWPKGLAKRKRRGRWRTVEMLQLMSVPLMDE